MLQTRGDDKSKLFSDSDNREQQQPQEPTTVNPYSTVSYGLTWSDARQLRNSILAGYAAGIVGTLVGHPFDSAKVWLQTEFPWQRFLGTNVSLPANRYPIGTTTSTCKEVTAVPLSLFRSVHTTANNLPNKLLPLPFHPNEFVYRARLLYAGVSGPLLAVGLVQSINFAVYDSVRRALYDPSQREEQRRYLTLVHGKQIDPMSEYRYCDSLANVAVASAVSGAVLAFITSPMQIAKVQQQVVPGLTLFQALARTWKIGPFTAFLPHFLSATIGRSIYMVTYEGAKRAWVHVRSHTSPNEDEVQDTTWSSGSSVYQAELTLAERMFSAALAGVICWATIFPLDSLRSRMYAASAENLRTTSGTLAMAQSMLQSGWRTFYKGFTVTVIRAGPVAAAVLPVYDIALEFLSKLE